MPHLERQAKVLTDLVCLRNQPRVGELGEIQEVRVVVEVDGLELRIAIQAEPTHDGPLEIPHEPVGHKEGRGAIAGDPIQVGAGEHLVAVRSSDPDRAMPLEDWVERAGGPAVAVDHDHVAIPTGELAQFAVDCLHDLLRIEVMHRGHTVDVGIPAVLIDNRFDFLAERSTDEQGDILHRSVSSSGNARTEMKESLKSARPESSTYSILSGSSKAICRSRKESSDIFAPSPAVFPTDRMRSTSTGGTRPMIFALSGFR